jgi:GAF domain-containing protein
VVLGVILAVIITQGLRLRSRGSDVQDIAALAMQLDELQRMTAGYADHVTNMLYAFQRVREGMLGDITVREWIEDGILEPARDLLKTRQTEDVRLSILMPDGDELVMLFAAGHTLESKKNFRLKLDESYSYWAFKKDTIYWSGDLATDQNFTRHPKATPEREYNSIISIPIHRGDHVVAIFNTIFTPKNAFDDADLIYVRLVGAIIDLVWQSTQGPGIPEPDDGPDTTPQA